MVGRYGSFDQMAARAVREAKKDWPEIRLTLLLPYLPEARFELPLGFDDSFYPPGMETVPKRVAIPRANEYMIRHCDVLICYDRGQPGNTRRLMELARRRQQREKIVIVNLAGGTVGNI